MGKIDIESELAKDNPSAKKVVLKVFAGAVAVYFEAIENILENGVICSHPRTGVPIENPYLKIQEKQGAILTRMTKENRIKSDRVIALLEKH